MQQRDGTGSSAWQRVLALLRQHKHKPGTRSGPVGTTATA
jgi:hypothetical protein